MKARTEWVVSPALWSRYWKHRNLRLFDEAPSELFDSGTSTHDRTLSDWNRLIQSGDECTYFIDGISLSKLADNKKFDTLDEFKEFLGETLFKSQGPVQKGHLIQMTLSFGYQAGLFHATNSAASKLIGESSRSQVSLPQANMRVDLTIEANGLTIKETNEYRKWTDNRPNAKKAIHQCGEDKPYYVKTETTYSMTPDKIEMIDLHVDCPSRNLAPFLDERKSRDQRVRFPIFKNSIAGVIDVLFHKAGFSNEPPTPRVLYDRNNGPSQLKGGA